MGHKSGNVFPVLFLAAVLVAPFHAAAADGEGPTRVATGEIAADTIWRGAYLLEGTVTVPAGVTLRIEPGTTLHFKKEASLVIAGNLRAEGDARQPILMAPDPQSAAGERWQGVKVQGEGSTARFSFCRWRGAEQALIVANSSADLADSAIEECTKALEAIMNSRVSLARCLVKGNKAGVDAQIQSRLTVTDSTFENNGAFGLRYISSAGGDKISGTSFRGEDVAMIISQAVDVFVSGNTFSGCFVGIGIDQVGSDIRLSGNTFEKGTTGIKILKVATPWIACCRFMGLENGIVMERFCNPLLINNLFDGNGTGISAVQKCNFPIARNVFKNNKRAIFLDLASYALIHENNFAGNGRDIVLGTSMSADYEHRVGTTDVTLQKAGEQQSHQMENLNEDREYVDTVDARNNWWGEETTREMQKGGAAANIGSLEDYYDTPEVTYPGWAEGTYRMDRVLYDPWEKAEISGAGPLPGGCGDLPSGGREPAGSSLPGSPTAPPPQAPEPSEKAPR